MMQRQTRPDWDHYSLEELEEALEGLDRESFPERTAMLEKLIRDYRPAVSQQAESTPFYLAPPNWAEYSLKELNEALLLLDRQRYPEREETIRNWIERRQPDHDVPGDDS